MRFESATLAAFMAGGLVSAATTPSLNFTSSTEGIKNYTSGRNTTIEWTTPYKTTSLKLFQQLANGTWVQSTLASNYSTSNTTYTWLAEPVDNSTSEAKNTTTYHFQLLNAKNSTCPGCLINGTDFSLLIANTSSSVPGAGGVVSTHKSTTTSSTTHKSTSSSTHKSTSSSSTHKPASSTQKTPSPSPTTHHAPAATTTHVPSPSTSTHKTTTSFTTKTITLPRSTSSKEPKTSIAGPVSTSHTPKATPIPTETSISKAASSPASSSQHKQQSLPAPIPVSHHTTRLTSPTNHPSVQTKTKSSTSTSTSTRHTSTHRSSKHSSTKHHKTQHGVTAASQPAAQFPTASLASSLSSNGAALYHSVGLGVGLGLGAPVILGFLACFGCFVRRRRRRRQQEQLESQGIMDVAAMSQPRYRSEKEAMRISALPLADNRESQRSIGDGSSGPPPYLRNSQISRDSDRSSRSEFDPEAFNFDAAPQREDETADFTAQVSHTINPAHIQLRSDAASSRYSLDDLNSIAGGQDLSTVSGALPEQPPSPNAVHPALRPGPNFI